MKTDRQSLTDPSRVSVIAEAGSNHNGDIKTAKELIRVAADSGADVVKFQLFDSDRLVVEKSGTDPDFDPNQSIHDAFEDLELPREWIPELYNCCREEGVAFMATPFDEDAVDRLEDYVPAYKIASSSVTHIPLLKYVGSKGKPVLMSTGAHDVAEIRTAVDTLRENGTEEIGLFHCVSAYPTPLEEINVRTVDVLRDEHDVEVGLSDHTEDPIVAPCAAVSRGAAFVEKHFTLDRSMDGPDHFFALEPDELREMVRRVRQTKRSLGDPTLGVREIEQKTYEAARRSIHATEGIREGEQISERNTAVLRPGKRAKGLPPEEYTALLGSTAVNDISEGDGVTWEDVE